MSLASGYSRRPLGDRAADATAFRLPLPAPLRCVAHMAMMALQFVPDLPPIEPELLAKHFKRKHGPGAYYGQVKA